MNVKKKTQRRLTQPDPGQESHVTDKHVIVTRVVFTSIYKCLLPSLDRDIGLLPSLDRDISLLPSLDRDISLLPSLDRDIGYLHYLCECEEFLLCKIHRKCTCVKNLAYRIKDQSNSGSIEAEQPCVTA